MSYLDLLTITKEVDELYDRFHTRYNFKTAMTSQRESFLRVSKDFAALWKSLQIMLKEEERK